MSNAFTPLYDKLVVKRDDVVTSTASGILLPTNAVEQPAQGTVVFAGCGRINESGDIKPLVVQVGDKVLFGKYAGSDVTLDGQSLLIMREEEVLGIVGR